MDGSDFLIGSLGSALLLLAFTLLVYGKVERDSTSYQMLNLIGAVLLTVYAWILQSWPFIILNVVWAIVAVVGVVRSKRPPSLTE